MQLITRLLLAALAYSRFVQCDDKDDGDDEYKVKGNDDAANATTPHVREGDHVVHFVTVGKADNNFYPNSIRASPGDVVMFQFYPSNHSVIKAAYGYPCIPYEDLGLPGHSFFSGFFPTNSLSDTPPSWNLTINSTEPIFYYCGAPTSCTDWGMVGVINANDSTPISNQIGLAREADFMLLPGEKWPTEAQQASMASLAATATTATFTVTETPNEAGEYYPSSSADGSHGHLDEHSNDLSTGAVAGIAVGSVVVALAGVGLLLLMLRTRKLKKRLDEQQAAQNQQNQQGPPLQGPMAAYPHASPWPTQQRQMSQLPPYQSHDAGADMYKHPDSDLYDVPSRSMSPLQQGSPYSAQGQQFMAFRPGDPRNRYTTHSELVGSPHPMSELHAPNPNMPEYDARSPS